MFVDVSLVNFKIVFEDGLKIKREFLFFSINIDFGLDLNILVLVALLFEERLMLCCSLLIFTDHPIENIVCNDIP